MRGRGVRGVGVRTSAERYTALYHTLRRNGGGGERMANRVNLKKCSYRFNVISSGTEGGFYTSRSRVLQNTFAGKKLAVRVD